MRSFTLVLIACCLAYLCSSTYVLEYDSTDTLCQKPLLAYNVSNVCTRGPGRATYTQGTCSGSSFTLKSCSGCPATDCITRVATINTCVNGYSPTNTDIPHRYVSCESQPVTGPYIKYTEYADSSCTTAVGSFVRLNLGCVTSGESSYLWECRSTSAYTSRHVGATKCQNSPSFEQNFPVNQCVLYGGSYIKVEGCSSTSNSDGLFVCFYVIVAIIMLTILNC